MVGEEMESDGEVRVGAGTEWNGRERVEGPTLNKNDKEVHL